MRDRENIEDKPCFEIDHDLKPFDIAHALAIRRLRYVGFALYLVIVDGGQETKWRWVAKQDHEKLVY